jgi:hypothetical protein
MSNYRQPVPEGKDPELWELAEKRAGFKSHLVSYVIVNAFLWALWYFTGSPDRELDLGTWSGHHYPWPIWPTLGWGIGLAFHYASVYILPKSNAVEKEYEKLKNQQNHKNQ